MKMINEKNTLKYEDNAFLKNMIWISRIICFYFNIANPFVAFLYLKSLVRFCEPFTWKLPLSVSRSIRRSMYSEPNECSQFLPMGQV